MLRLPGLVRPYHETDWTETNKQIQRIGDANNHIFEHHRLTNHRIDWDSAPCLTYRTNYFQRRIVESWYLEQTPLERCQIARNELYLLQVFRSLAKTWSIQESSYFNGLTAKQNAQASAFGQTPFMIKSSKWREKRKLTSLRFCSRGFGGLFNSF